MIRVASGDVRSARAGHASRAHQHVGFDGQTGSPRLVPMTRAEDVFLAYVRKPATPGMPSFEATPEQELRGVYAYVRAIPRAAPTPESLALLEAIMDRRTKAN